MRATSPPSIEAVETTRYRPSLPSTWLRLWLTLLLLQTSQAAFLSFDNCLPADIRSSKPVRLQFEPLFVDAKFDTQTAKHSLDLIIYGNVKGQATEGPYPPPDSPQWKNDSLDFGKIVNVSASFNHITTLYTKTDVLSYTAFDSGPTEFCDYVIHGSCPVAPVFDANNSDPSTLRALRVSHDYQTSYAFATFANTVRVESGDEGAPLLACISTNITPDLGTSITNTLKYLPVICLILTGFSTIFAAIYSPWGSTDPFKWTSNFGRDEDVLRLATPGFADCLQYIQFIVLTGSLSLQYPGFYQPAVSQASWSVLLFGQSYVSSAPPTPRTVDGVYVANGAHGLDRLGQLVGFGKDSDIWAGMTVTLLGVIAGFILLTSIGIALRIFYRKVSRHPDEVLRSKVWPFTGGNIVRIVLLYFLLPIVSISMFQLVISPNSPASVVAGAVVLLAATMLLAAWISRFILVAKPRAHLFDDLPTLLLYGPLYNTYSDETAGFAIINTFLIVIRGIAIGAIQPSGVAQITVLAICEIIQILCLHAFPPFFRATSMNLYHIILSLCRFFTVVMMIVFVPSLGVEETSKGWIGYIVLGLQALVLIFAFFLNAIQAIIEVAARLMGAGGQARGGLTKVLKHQQKANRANGRGPRDSRGSAAHMLAPDPDARSVNLMTTRTRSMSASSAVLLNQHRTSDGRISAAFEQVSQGGDASTPDTPAIGSNGFGPAASMSPRNETFGRRASGTADPYYRQPRPRQTFVDTKTPGSKSRSPWHSGEWSGKPYTDAPIQMEGIDAGEGPSSTPAARSSVPTQLYMRNLPDDSDLDNKAKPTDYTVRESDFYYGITRGPALSSMPSRRFNSGTADSAGPVASMSGWFSSLFGGKQKDKSKGFEVVRSTRAPVQMMPLDDEASPGTAPKPYRDDPDRDVPGSRAGRRSIGDDDITSARHGVQPRPDTDESGSEGSSDSDDSRYGRGPLAYTDAPTLEPIDAGTGLDMPSRWGSERSKNTRRENEKPSRRSTRRSARRDGGNLLDGTIERVPTVPRKSSRRKSKEPAQRLELPNLAPVSGSPSHSPSRSMDTGGHNPASHDDSHFLRPSTGRSTGEQSNLRPSSHRIPFGGSSADRSPSPQSRLSPSVTTTSAASMNSSLYPAGDGLVDQERLPGSKASTHGVGRGALASLAVGDAAASVASGSLDIGRSGNSLHKEQSGSDYHFPPASIPSRSRAGTGASQANPVNTGYVQQHLAGEGIRQSLHAPSLGTEAEVVRNRSGSTSASREDRRSRQ